MSSRFRERLERQSQAIKTVWGEARQHDPPPYSSVVPTPESRILRSSLSEASQSGPPPQYTRSVHSRQLPLEPLLLPINSLVLVTGACGWQGLHITDILLELGFRVRGAVQHVDDAAWMSKYFEQKYGYARFTFVVVTDMVPRGAYDNAVEGCRGVIHCASVTNMSPDPTEVITPSIAGALNALDAAEKEPLVQRFVYTSSWAAAVSKTERRRQEVTSESWNMDDVLNAWQPPPYTSERSLAVYASSKLQTEQMVWRWYKDHRPHFTLNSVLPATLLGRQLAPEFQKHRSSVSILKAIWDGDVTVAAKMTPNHFVDVQDSALIHIAALILPDIQDQRLFATHTPFDCNELLRITRKLFPFRPFPDDIDQRSEKIVFREAVHGERLLDRMGQRAYTDLRTSVQRCCEGFVVQQNRGI